MKNDCSSPGIFACREDCRHSSDNFGCTSERIWGRTWKKKRWRPRSSHVIVTNGHQCRTSDWRPYFLTQNMLDIVLLWRMLWFSLLLQTLKMYPRHNNQCPMGDYLEFKAFLKSSTFWWYWLTRPAIRSVNNSKRNDGTLRAGSFIYFYELVRYDYSFQSSHFRSSSSQ